jgi:hypothetical protein
MTVQEMLYQQMNHFIGLTTQKGMALTVAKVIEIGGYIGAYTIRTRHLQQGHIEDEAIHGVIGTLGNFCHEYFPEQFHQEDFNALKTNILELLKVPTFDTDAKDYFATYYQ